MIRFNGISKHFPGVTALRDVSFEVARGSCHALLGENGAGKSTLGKILAGLDRPDAGEILLDGKPALFPSPRDAVQAGVGIVHQELVFCPSLSIAENLCLHDLPARGMWLDRKSLKERAQSRLARVQLELDVAQPISTLSLGQEQLVQIAAAVGMGARVLVFDEPTSTLGRSETERLFQLIRQLLADGVTIIYVSHRLEEIDALCDAVTVLRDGCHIGTRPLSEVNHSDLVRMMVGRDITPTQVPKLSATSHPERLRVEGWELPGILRDIELQVSAGEIVGLAGLVGAGRTELLESLYGLAPGIKGVMSLDGEPIRVTSPGAALANGIGLVPEDRKRHGLHLGMNVRENITLPILDRLRHWCGFVNRTEERQVGNNSVKQLSIRTASLETGVNTLSGGNQQKIVIAKGIAAKTRILLIDEPTRGVDVGAKQEIHILIRQFVEEGGAVLLASSDLPELLELSDHVVVLREGEIVSRLTRAEANPETVLRAMVGIGNEIKNNNAAAS